MLGIIGAMDVEVRTIKDKMTGTVTTRAVLPSARSRRPTESHSASIVASASSGRGRSCGIVTLLP